MRRNTDLSTIEMPTTAQLLAELKRTNYKTTFAYVVRQTIYTLIVVAAIAVLIAVLLLPVLKIYGSSMAPTLDEGEIVVSLKGGKFDTGDVIAFYYNNKILVKRVIAQPGEWVSMDADGTVYVNGEEIDEPYLFEKAYGECDLEWPYQVPENRIFVMGDHRSVSVDSRSSTVGCIAEEEIVGKIVYKVWPLSMFGPIT